VYDFPYMKNLKGHDPNELIYKTETDPQTHIMSLWLLGRRGGGGIVREFGMVMYRWPKHWSFSLNISPSKEIQGLISFRMDWLDLLAV